MSTQEFISQLSQQGIVVQLVDGELKIKGPQSHINQFIGQIRERKPEIIVHLTAPIQAVEPKSENIREYTYPDGRVLRLTEQEFGELVDLFKTLHHWEYGQFIP